MHERPPPLDFLAHVTGRADPLARAVERDVRTAVRLPGARFGLDHVMVDVPPTLRLLVVEDDVAYAALLVAALEDIGHRVTHVANGRDALLALDAEAFDAALVDRLMPGLDGVTLVKQVRAGGRTLPVMMLTALGRTADKIEGLASGADDYVVKPASVDEIDARLHALLRGRAWRSAGADTVRAGDIVVSPVRFLAWRGGVPLRLAKIEFNLLLELARASGDTLTRATLVERVWGRDAHTGSNIVDAQIRTLRAKLVAVTGEAPDPIEAVRGVGYRLRT